MNEDERMRMMMMISLAKTRDRMLIRKKLAKQDAIDRNKL